MAELAAGAVHSLLGVIRDEAHLLGRVETDVQFIKEEMESMSSFLLHLSSTAPPGGADEHGEQVRTWMKQVRELAHDCNNSIDRYLQRGNPALYRAGRGPLGLNYVFWWVPWYLQKLTAQHIAAIELRELKDRARDVGKRRLRYDVQIPKPTTTATNGSTSTPSSSQIIPHDEEDEDEDVGPNIHDRLARRELIFAEPCTKEECRAELVEWLRKAKVADDEDQLKSIPIAASNQEKGTSTANGLRTTPIAESNQGEGSKMRSIAGQEGFRAIAIVAPEQEEGVDVASAAIFADEAKFDCKFTINVFTGPEMMPTGLPAGAFDILEPIMNQFGIGQVKEEEDAQTKRQAEIHEVNEAQQQPKMRDIDQKIDKIKAKIKKHLHTTSTTMSIDNVPLMEVEPLDILLHGIQEQPWVQVVNTDLSKDQMKTKKIEETAKKIKEHMESRYSPVGLDLQEYVNILQKRLGRTNEEATDKSDDEISKSIKEIKLKIKSVEEATDKLGDEQIAKKIKETAEKIIMVNKLEELLLKPTETEKLEEKRKKKGTNKQHAESQMLEKKITATTNAVLQDIKKKLQSKMAEKIKEYLAGKKTLILLIGMDYSYKWAEIMKALSSLGCAPGSAVVVTTRYTHGADEFCNPPGEQPILCYLAASYYKKVLEIMMKQPINYNTSIFRDILERCEPHQFSMKIFAHAMFANPRRKKEELDKLLETLAPRGSLDKTNDKKMIKFSYSDLPKDFKTCLLYLAIFQPKDDKKPEAILQPKDDRKPEAILQPKDDRKPEKEYDTINRSRLVGRWVVEGMITKQDWSSSVLQAERCFDALVDRHLICPHNIGATGKVKSCTVDATVHEFITKVAKKRHIVEARLSHHLAKHFSVLSDVRLRSSDNMKKFFKKLDVSPQLPLVKVLDLQGCQDWDKNCLRHICSKMLLLKYLSLRDTGITELPHQINNLHQLEVLDIRQKENIVTASTTRDVLLLKLKRLLAGSSTPTNTQNVRIPRGIAKMTNLEVLSRVKASSSRAGRDLKDIGRLWQLRKLGVVLDDDRPGHLTYLLEAIGDLSESLRSLSITLTHGKGGPHCNRAIEENIGDNYSNNPPKLLESLSIDGYTCKGQLLPWLLKDNKLSALAKVTLCNTFLNEGNMEHLAELDNLCCLRLMGGAYTDSRLSFLCAKFKGLKYLLVECGKPDEISFDVGAAPELSKIVISSITITSVESLPGIANLTKLKELEINGKKIPDQVWKKTKHSTN